MKLFLAATLALAVLIPPTARAQTPTSGILGVDKGGPFAAVTYRVSSTPLAKNWSLELSPFGATRLSNGNTGLGVEFDIRRTFGPAYAFVGFGAVEWNDRKPDAALLVGVGFSF